MKHLAKIQSEFLKYADLSADIVKSDKSKKQSVFLGGDCSDNNWREEIKKQYPEIIFLDPYDDDWTPEKNIYNECAGLAKADFVIFYKGGDLTEKEKDYLRTINKDYKEFDDLEKLNIYLRRMM